MDAVTIFGLIIEKFQQELIEKCLQNAERMGHEKSMVALSNAQLSGIQELATDSTVKTVDDIRKKINDRHNKRWKDAKAGSPFEKLDNDIKILEEGSQRVVDRASAIYKQFYKLSIDDTIRSQAANQLASRLIRRYLTASVEFCKSNR